MTHTKGKLEPEKFLAIMFVCLGDERKFEISMKFDEVYTHISRTCEVPSTTSTQLNSSRISPHVLSLFTS